MQTVTFDSHGYGHLQRVPSTSWPRTSELYRKSLRSYVSRGLGRNLEEDAGARGIHANNSGTAGNRKSTSPVAASPDLRRVVAEVQLG